MQLVNVVTGEVLIVWRSFLQAIRLRCLNCSAFNAAEVKRCEHNDCDLWPFRMGRRNGKKTSRVQIIRKYCLWCCSNQSHEVRLCPSETCPLWPFRFGKHPKTVIRQGRNETCRVLRVDMPADEVMKIKASVMASPRRQRHFRRGEGVPTTEVSDGEATL